LSHIRAENMYCEERTEHLKPLQDVLYEEMLSHLKETDEEVKKYI
jgi:protease II